LFKTNRPKPPIWKILLYMILSILAIFLLGLLRTHM